MCTGHTAGTPFCSAAGTSTTCTLVDGCPKATTTTDCTATSLVCVAATGTCGCPSTGGLCDAATGASAQFCSADLGGTYVCTRQDNNCYVASAVTACPANGADGANPLDKLTCSPATATCECPADTGALSEFSGCPVNGQQVCDVQGNVAQCSSINVGGVGGKTCQVWDIFGTADGGPRPGDCVAIGLTCNATSTLCTCPVNNSSNEFVNPIPSRVELNSRLIPTTGVQNPPVCAFETITQAITAVNKLTSPRGAIVLAGGTPSAPAAFLLSRESGPLTIKDGTSMTVDTDVELPGIIVPTDTGGAPVAFDPRNNVIVADIDLDGAPVITLSSGGTEGGQLHGFAIAAGGCGAADCGGGPSAAIRVDGAGANSRVRNRNRPRLDSLFLEGGGGLPVAVGLDATVTFAGSAGAHNTLAAAATLSDAQIVAMNAGGANIYIALDGAFAGVYGPASHTVGASNVVTFTVNTPGVFTSGPAHISVARQGDLTQGLVINHVDDGTAGSVANLVAENFQGASSSMGVSVNMTGDAAAVTFAGVHLLNNYIGLDVTAGAVTIGDAPAPVAQEFPAITIPFVSTPLIDQSGGVGVFATGGSSSVSSSDLTVTLSGVGGPAPATGGGTPNGTGVHIVNGATASLATSHVDANDNDGALINSLSDPTLTLFSNGSTFSGNGSNGVDVQQGNVTLTASAANGNGEDGLLVHGDPLTTVRINGGTLNGNTLRGLEINDCPILKLPATGDSTPVVTTGIGAGGTNNLADINSNGHQGVFVQCGTLNLTSANVDFNGTTDLCPDDGNVLEEHEVAVELPASSVGNIHFTNSFVVANIGGGARIVNLVGNTSENTFFDQNAQGGHVPGGGCAFVDTAGLTIGDGDSDAELSLINVRSTAGSNGVDGVMIYEFGTLDSAVGPTGAAINADSNNDSGLIVNGVANLNHAGTTASANCQNPEHVLLDGGIAVGGTLDTTGAGLVLTGNKCDGILVNSTTDERVILAGVNINTNAWDGIRILGAPGHVATNPEGSGFDTDSPLTQWHVLVSLSTVHDNNTGVVAAPAARPNNAGIAVGTQGGVGQVASVYAFVKNSTVFNNKIGIYAAGDPDGSPGTGFTIGNTQVNQNLAEGLFIERAFLRVDDSTATGPVGARTGGYGIYSNLIDHNGFPAGNTTCTGETNSQVAFVGVVPRPSLAADCTTLGDTCLDNTQNFCVVNPTAGCQRAYQLEGNPDSCGTSAPNSIFGYEAVNEITHSKIAVVALSGAAVNMDANRLRSGAGAGTDWGQDAGAGSFTQGRISTVVQCTSIPQNQFCPAPQ